MMCLSTKHVKASMVEYQGGGEIGISYSFFLSQPLYWNNGFSTEWLADFSLSMTNSHFLKPLNHTLKNIYKMFFCLKPGKTHKLLQNGMLDPFPAPTFHRMVPYRHPNPSHSVEEMATGIILCISIYIYILYYIYIILHIYIYYIKI